MIPRNLLPEGLVAFIAGGYAACPALAEDMDVWVSTRLSRKPVLPLPELRQLILDHLKQQGFMFAPQDDTRQTEAGLEGYEIEVNILKVAMVSGESLFESDYRLPIHILVTDANCSQVLEGFDISTHQVALTYDGPVVGRDWTPLTEEPVVLKNSPKTPARLEKIRNRYKGAYAQV